MDIELNGSLMHLLHRASQAAEVHFSQLTDNTELADLTARQFIVLAAAQKSEGQSQASMTELTGIDRSTITDIIGRLQSRGLLQRSRSQVDARSYEVRLTPAGRKQLEAALAVAREVDNKMLSLVPRERHAEFCEYLRLIAIGS